MEIKTLRNKADKLLQEWGRRTYNVCECCGMPMSCLHHWFPKSSASALRYYKQNLIPICARCHLRHHNGDPRPHAVVLLKRGEKWYKDLLKEKTKIIKANLGYYTRIIEEIKTWI
jgi:5-methylcytosine-specific restriction endonuclease McrA